MYISEGKGKEIRSNKFGNENKSEEEEKSLDINEKKKKGWFLANPSPSFSFSPDPFSPLPFKATEAQTELLFC